MNAGFHHLQEQIHYVNETKSNADDLVAGEDVQLLHQRG